MKKCRVTRLNTNIRTILVLLVMTSGVLAVSGRHEAPRKVAADKQKAAEPVARPKPAQLPQRALDFYLAGLVAEGSGDIPAATLFYDSAWQYYPQSVEIGIAYAQALLYDRKIREALEALQRISPPVAEQLGLIAFCYRQLSNDDLAREAYLQMLTLDSSRNVGYMFLANYYQQKGNSDSALWALRNLARTMPENYQVLNELGKAYIVKSDWKAAKDAFRRSLELAPLSTNMDALLNLADIYQRNQQADSVERLFETAAQDQPDNAFLQREISRLLLEKDSVNQALPHLWAAARLEPNDYSAQRRLAIVLISTDSLATADSILTSLVQAGDSEPANHYYLGRVAALKNDNYRARDEFQLVTQAAPSISDGWLSLAFVYRRLGQPENEIDTYRNALIKMTEEKNAVQVYFALGAAFEQQGQVDSAVATLETLLQNSPDHAPSLNYLGYLLADRGLRLEYARDLIARALKQEPKNPAYLDSYGWVYYRLGNFKEAVKYLKMAVELDSDPVIYDHLGDAYQSTGKTKQAREWWQKALDQQPDNATIKQKLQR